MNHNNIVKWCRKLKKKEELTSVKESEISGRPSGHTKNCKKRIENLIRENC